jgi:hypothetical protein
MRTKGLMMLAFLLIFAKSYSQDDKSRFGFELNSGVSLATSELGHFKLKPGIGFEGMFHYNFAANWGVYVGWGWNKLTSKDKLNDYKPDFEETGYVFGLQFKHPIGELPLKYYIRTGGLYNHIEVEDSNGNIVEDTGHGLGWQIAGGLEINLSPRCSLVPGFRYNSLSRTSKHPEIMDDMKLKYISLRVGIIKMF